MNPQSRLSVLTGGAALLSALLLSQAGLAQTEYTYDYQGTTIELVPTSSALALVLKKADNAQVQPEAAQLRVDLPRDFSVVERVEVIEQAGIAVIELRPGAVQSQLAELTAFLRGSPAVVSVEPVLAYQGIECVAGDEILAQFDLELSDAQVEQRAAECNADVVMEFHGHNGWRLLRSRDTARWSAFDVSSQLRLLEGVQTAEPNLVQFLQPLSDPNDAHFPNQWALRNLGTNSPSGLGQAGADIQALGGWDLTTGRPDVIVAVLDEGVDTGHEDLHEKIVAPYDATDGDTNQEPNPWDGHGTACAGIIAASSNNSTGIAGVAWRSKIMPIRIAFSSAAGNNWTTQNSWIGLGITTAVLQGADVLSNSWGGGPPSNFITSAIELARSSGRDGKGCVVVFAAGNDDLPSVIYPGSLPDVITVGATNELDRRVTTAWSGSWGSNYGPEIDVVAPGISIWTTDITGTGAGYNQGSGGDAAGNYYAWFDGTSAATPHVAGVAALILAAEPLLTSDQVQEIIEQSAEDVVGDPQEDVLGRDDYMGWGRINARAALERVSGCSGQVNFCSTSPNSVGGGALISWTGTPSAADDNFHLVATGCPANQPLLFYYGGAQAAAPFGNGVRCVGGGGVGVFRFQPMQVSGTGVASMKVDFSQAPAGGGGAGMWSPGDTWYCQGWYRDPAAGGAAFNLTDGLEVRVCAGGGAYAGTVLVPGGSFAMGRHVGSGGSDELPVHTVTVFAFYMDVFEVSNQAYADYLNTAYAQGRVTLSSNVVYQVGGAGEALCDTVASSNYSRITWNGTTFGVTAGKQDHPMVMVSWYGACAYANGRSRAAGLTPCYNETTWNCDFNADGFRLPTEAEWEYAARGGEHNPYYKYPWGDSIDGSKANYSQSGDPFETGAYPWTSPVGYYTGAQVPSGTDMANGYGLYDMAGNVREWCNDWYSGSYYSSSPGNNPTGPASGSTRVFRGGGWAYSPSYLRSANRGASIPTFRNYALGLRVLAVRP